MSEVNGAPTRQQADVWTVVLAGGAGRRLRAVTNGVPKQFWQADGRPSLLNATLDRLAPCAPPSRTVVVVDRGHMTHLRTAPLGLTAEQVLYQPQDRGTAAGVLFGLMPILDRARDAVIVLTPADHGVANATTFHRGIERAVAAVRSRRLGAVLFGVEPDVEPDAAATDYGWITPGVGYPSLDVSFQTVTGFVEKPLLDVARQLVARGALLNTMVLVARVEALVDLYRTHLPALTEVFTRSLDMGSGERAAYLAESYARLPPNDFSRDLLGAADDLAVYRWPPSIGWSDLGTPARLHAWLGGPMKPTIACAS